MEKTERELAMEKTVLPPELGKTSNLDLQAALKEKLYLENYPSPKYGWTRPIAMQVENRIALLNKIIADIILEGKNENGKC